MIRYALILLAMVGSVGCIASHQSVVEDVNVEWWGESKEFSINNIDTVTLRDMEIFVCYYPSMVADSISLIVDITTPDTLTLRERVTIYLNNKPSERSQSRITQRIYRDNIVWSELGEYTIGITPASNYHGISAVGINTTKSD